MPEKQTQTHPVGAAEKIKRAYGILADVRAALYQRLAEYVLNHESRIRGETLGEESYSFCLQQMEDQFLSRLNVIERAVAELARHEPREGPPGPTTYEVVEVTARREELPQKVADVLAERGESDLLDVCVLRADEHQAEVMLVLAREETARSGRSRPGAGREKPGSDET